MHSPPRKASAVARPQSAYTLKVGSRHRPNSASSRSSQRSSVTSSDASGLNRVRDDLRAYSPTAADRALMAEPLVNTHALAPPFDKWGLISSAVGTTNALQQLAVESRARACFSRVHPRDREPGALGANHVARTSKGDEDSANWLSMMRVNASSLYASWERCSRFWLASLLASGSGVSTTTSHATACGMTCVTHQSITEPCASFACSW